MRRIDAGEIAEKMKLYGRTYLDRSADVLYFNWTCGGFEVEFFGSCVSAEFCALPDRRMERFPGDTVGTVQNRSVPDWPWIAVILDDEEEPEQKIMIDQKEKQVILFSAARKERHRLRVIKLNENYRTAIGIHALTVAGELLEVSEDRRRRIEFIGDSITCGFGNLATDGNREFFTAEENGWLTHGAIAARKLHLKPSFISLSGITVARQGDLPVPYAMMELYPYTDRIIQDKLEQNETYEVWNFEKNLPDFIVLNLGTNDSTGVLYAGDPAAAEEAFEENYYQFIKMIRTLNGTAPKLICALGSVDYYLYDRIQKAVERWKRETADPNIYCMKYTKMLMMGLDVGACFHPSVHRQARMADELTAFIQVLEGDKNE